VKRGIISMRFDRACDAARERYRRQRGNVPLGECPDWESADRYQLEPVEAMWDRSERE